MGMNTDFVRPSWLTIVLAAATLVTLVMAGPESYRSVPAVYMEDVGVYSGASEAPAGAPTAAESAMMGGGQGMIAPDYYRNDPSVTDTREFLKINYGAQMKTRDVKGLTRRVETTVRGYDGRIDSESTSPEASYVSFVVPQSKYESFRTELEGLVGSRFLEVSISSQNRLGEKQSIEEQAKSASATLASYQATRDSLVAAHTSRVKSLQAQIDTQNAAIGDYLEQAPSATRDANIARAEAAIADYRAQLANENSAYATKLATSDANIKYAKDWQKAIATNDQAFLDDIATVSGSVSIRLIGLFEMAQLYLPEYWIPAIFALLTLLSYSRDRRRARLLV
jgi:hypothetical protein